MRYVRHVLHVKWEFNVIRWWCLKWFADRKKQRASMDKQYLVKSCSGCCRCLQFHTLMEWIKLKITGLLKNAHLLCYAANRTAQRISIYASRFGFLRVSHLNIFEQPPNMEYFNNPIAIINKILTWRQTAGRSIHIPSIQPSICWGSTKYWGLMQLQYAEVPQILRLNELTYPFQQSYFINIITYY